MSTLFLDPNTWDLALDSSGNIAVANEPYSFAQDAATAIRLFLGELYYDTTQGVPYWESILGKTPPLPFIRAQLIAAAVTVVGVVSADCVITFIDDRSIHGVVTITTKSGQTATVNF